MYVHTLERLACPLLGGLLKISLYQKYIGTVPYEESAPVTVHFTQHT